MKDINQKRFKEAKSDFQGAIIYNNASGLLDAMRMLYAIKTSSKNQDVLLFARKCEQVLHTACSHFKIENRNFDLLK